MKRYLLAIVACFTQQIIIADPVISLFLRPYPILDSNNHEQALLNHLTQSGGSAHKVPGILNKQICSGIFETYAGYINVSNYDCHITFPRKHEKPIVYVVITSKITPNIITENTIHHWDLEPGTSTEIYRYERSQDPTTKLFYWSVEKVDLPEDMRVPAEALLIFTKPKNVYVPTGITVTTNTPNLVLPDIYVKRKVKILSSTLYVLNIKQFFGQTKDKYKKQPTAFESLIEP